MFLVYANQSIFTPSLTKHHFAYYPSKEYHVQHYMLSFCEPYFDGLSQAFTGNFEKLKQSRNILPYFVVVSLVNISSLSI